MKPDPTQPQPPVIVSNPNTDMLLEHLLEKNDDNSKHTNSLLENLIEQGAKEDSIEPLLEGNMEMQDKVVKKLDELIQATNQTWDINLILE